MNIAQISDNLEKIIESFNKDSFIFDLLLAYGTPKATISRLRQGGKEMCSEEIVVIKKKLFFQKVTTGDLQTVLNNLKLNDKVTKQTPRFIVVTDYETLLAYDTKTDESLDIPILQIPQYNDFFLPWAGMEKSKQQTENIADVKAAERMAKLYDEIKKDNPTTTHEEVHNLNVFLSRLLFCYFAEDTEIFDKDLFTKSVDYHTQKDGSDLNVYLDALFEVMNTPQSARKSVSGVELPAYLKAFPYVNGGLFRNQHAAPVFTRRSRQMLIDCGLSLQWQDINPDIFGSMIQAVIMPEHRGGMGMHYTSVPNIMKVIEPLFLDDLKEEFDNSKGNKKKLNELLQRIWKIKIFDPACGSGNFLIIAYKELRKLEMKIFKELGTLAFSEINLGNFYGIELDDFAHEVATLSLWLAEHQMNQEFMREFGRCKPALPLQETGNIVNGNACRVDWEMVCPKNEGDEIYILGNPPYLGFSMQSQVQKDDMSLYFGISTKLDYIACWFYKACVYIKDYNAKLAFVSTNSICQGEQVSLLWPLLYEFGIEIYFAHKSFKWSNNAKEKAAVICSIIGISNQNKKNKRIFIDNFKYEVKEINPYLISASNKTIIFKRNSCLSFNNDMVLGNMAKDGGNLFLTREEKNRIIKTNPTSIKFIKRALGSNEFINGIEQFCLWITYDTFCEASSIPEINSRIEKVALMRNESIKGATKEYAQLPYRFVEVRHQNTDALIIPRVSSERRDYIPIGFINSDIVIKDSAFGIYNADLSLLSILTSKMHMSWVSVVAGRLKTDYRYSSQLCYNTYPFPPISDKQKKELEQHVYNILAEREKHSEKTLAQLYDPDKMPDGLREAHRQNDLAVERCYRNRPFESDEERLEYLFKLYEQMIEEEKEKGTLFLGKKESKK